MAIIKTRKRENPYLQIDKTGIDDPNISFRATGLLAYLVGRPSDWNIRLEHLAKVKKERRDAIKATLVELREAEYCHYFEIRHRGKVKETFYYVYEVPTPYDEKLHQDVLDSLEGLEEGDTVYHKIPTPKKKKETEPKVENPPSTRRLLKRAVQPKVEKPFGEKALGENPTLLIIDNTNKRDHKKKNHDHERDDLIFYEKLLEEFGIKMTHKIKNAIQKMKQNKNLTEKDIEDYIRTLWKDIQETPEIENPIGLFTYKLERQEVQKVKDYLPDNYKELKKVGRESSSQNTSSIELVSLGDTVLLEDEKTDSKDSAFEELMESFLTFTLEEKEILEEIAIEKYQNEIGTFPSSILALKKKERTSSIYYRCLAEYLDKAIQEYISF